MKSFKLDASQKQVIQDIINYYCQNFDAINLNEEYKWEAITQFQSVNPMSDKKLFPNKFKESLSKQYNLISSYDIGPLIKLSQKDTDNLWGMLMDLSDETKSLKSRLEKFSEVSKIRIKETRVSTKKSLDVSTAMMILTLWFPDEYYFYRYYLLKSVADLLNIRIPKEPEERACLFESLCEAALKIVREHNELRSRYERFLDSLGEGVFQDPELHLLVQNVLYTTIYHSFSSGEAVEISPEVEYIDYFNTFQRVQTKRKSNSGKIKKVDPEEKYSEDLRKKSIGERGEEAVWRDERRKWINTSLYDLVIHESLNNDNAHYDIRSFDSDGNEKFIEVKTCKQQSKTCIFFSQAEVEFSQTHADNYSVYIVILRGKGKLPQCAELHGDITNPEVLGLRYSPDAVEYVIYLERIKGVNVNE